ncbi:MAG: ATP-binding protein [Coprococcus sp.]
MYIIYNSQNYKMIDVFDSRHDLYDVEDEHREEIWFRVSKLPDLTLSRYSSLEEAGVSGVLEKHIAFLRQLNRKGVISNVSFHLFYMYFGSGDVGSDRPGNRIELLLMVRGKNSALSNVTQIIQASPLADFYNYEILSDAYAEVIEKIYIDRQMSLRNFNSCSFLSKTETVLSGNNNDGQEYYMIREWEMNDNGRLYNMTKMMESIDESCLYRVDLYPVERAESLRRMLAKPISVLRDRQNVGFRDNRDYNGKDVLKRYEDMLESYESSPHFIANIMVFSANSETSSTVLDSAGAEALLKGKYSITTFHGNFTALSFIGDKNVELENLQDRMVVKTAGNGLVVCREDKSNLNLNFLPVFFTLEEIAPFFRFPALYDGEDIQMPKETSPVSEKADQSLYLGKDEKGYAVNIPIKMLPKHAFISGVPGSGKTNTMYHIVSSLWKKHRIPFLVLEPAKKEYRALLNDPAMKDVYLFSPNADMSFPLHINPFDMPKGCIISEHIQTLKGVFEGAFTLDNPMPFILDTGIEAVYKEMGWNHDDVYTGNEKDKDGNKRRFPSMSQLYKKLEELVETMDYGDEVKGNLKSALNVRIGSLLQREMGDVFDVTESTFSPEEWLEKPVCIELESMGEGTANFMNLMLCALIRESLKVDPHPVYENPDDVRYKCRHVIFIEEAHNLIGPESENAGGQDADAKVSATAFIAKMLAEVRALKEGIFIADQLPTKMADEVIKNTGLKLALRITSQDDRQLLGGTMSARGVQLEQMATFEPGRALIFYEGLMRPFKIIVSEYGGEIKDKAEKEEWLDPKTDSALMSMLQDRDTYVKTFEKSISIYGAKYIMLHRTQEKRMDTIKKWLDAMWSAQKKIQESEQRELLLQQRNETNETVWADMYTEIISTKKNFERLNNESQKNSRMLEDIIRTYGEYIRTLDRLLDGRWRRGGISEKYTAKIRLIERTMVGRLYRLMLYYQQTVGKGVYMLLDEALRIYESRLKQLDKYIEKNEQLIIQLAREM